jgi:hypothetical protein
VPSPSRWRPSAAHSNEGDLSGLGNAAHRLHGTLAACSTTAGVLAPSAALVMDVDGLKLADLAPAQ